MGAKIHRTECYFKNPATGEIGWDIDFPEVLAINREQAAKKMLQLPNFDCFVEPSWNKYNTTS